MLCCEDGCGYHAINLGRCPDHVIKYRRKHPGKARKHDAAEARAEREALNAHGKAVLNKLKEAHNGQGQDT